MEAIQQPDTEVQEPRSPVEFVQSVLSVNNLAEFEDFDWNKIAQIVLDGYQRDKSSMGDWFDKMQRGIDLANMAKKDKDYPFKGAANIKYPLITSAALQFNARSFPAVVPPEGPCKPKIHGKDPQGTKAARGARVAEFLSYQLVNEIEEWVDETDKLLVQLPYVGQMFRKVWYDPIDDRPRCRLIDAGKLIVSDKINSLAQAPRITEEIPLYPDEIDTRINSGQFVSFDWSREEDGDKDALQDFIEQHVRLDLDEDGYEEPYIVTVHVETRKVVRCVPDFDEDDVSFKTEDTMVSQVDPATGATFLQPVSTPVGITAIKRNNYYIGYKFLPSLTSGYHGTGLGLLLGDISDTVNTLFNQLLDAGHYASLGGGFIGSEFKIKGGAQGMRPGEWRTTNTPGAAIANSIVPIRYPAPDATLYQMLGMLIEAAREIASVKDVMTGDQGRSNQPATTTLALIEQGMMVFSAVFKRIFNSLKKEYRLIAKINAHFLSSQKYTAFHDVPAGNGQPMPLDPSHDFGAVDMDVEPVADPSSVTKMQKAQKAQVLMAMPPGTVNPVAASQRALEAIGIEDVEGLLPQPDPMQMEMAQMQMQAQRAALAQAQADIELTIAKTQAEQAKAMKDAASPEIEARKTQIEATLGILKDERDRIATLLGAAAKGMAGTPGHGGNPPPYAQGPAPQPQVGNGGLLVGLAN